MASQKDKDMAAAMFIIGLMSIAGYLFACWLQVNVF